MPWGYPRVDPRACPKRPCSEPGCPRLYTRLTLRKTALQKNTHCGLRRTGNFVPQTYSHTARPLPCRWRRWCAAAPRGPFCSLMSSGKALRRRTGSVWWLPFCAICRGQAASASSPCTFTRFSGSQSLDAHNFVRF